jgi:hypothetical protein
MPAILLPTAACARCRSMIARRSRIRHSQPSVSAKGRAMCPGGWWCRGQPSNELPAALVPRRDERIPAFDRPQGPPGCPAGCPRLLSNRAAGSTKYSTRQNISNGASAPDRLSQQASSPPCLPPSAQRHCSRPYSPMIRPKTGDRPPAPPAHLLLRAPTSGIFRVMRSPLRARPLAV